MKALVLLALAFSASAQTPNVTVERKALGLSMNSKVENAKVVDNSGLENDILHGTQYMPGFPTAATIWPRVVAVPCVKADEGLKCEGYRWSPALGRGEYLFITPQVVERPAPPPPVIVTVPGPERIVLKEVPVKKQRE